jgi:AcrR family transcriptional regulator
VKRGNITRLALLRAAETLFLAKGIEAVSLREISAAAGQGNHSAAGYHFKTIDGVVDAILERHSTPVQDRWALALDTLLPSATLIDVLAVMTVPLVEKLDDADGGRAYLSVCAQLAVTQRQPLEQRAVAQTPAVLRLIGAAVERLPAGVQADPLRFALLSGFLYTAILQYDRLHEMGLAPSPRQAFGLDLARMAAGLVTGSASG